jgi:hypothetical protein
MSVLRNTCLPELFGRVDSVVQSDARNFLHAEDPRFPTCGQVLRSIHQRSIFGVLTDFLIRTN